MKTSEEITETVTRVVAEQLAITEDLIQPDTDITALGADSLDLVEIIMEVEDEYEIEIPDEDVEHMKSVQEFVTYLAGLGID